MADNKYPSGEVFLQICKSEYENEQNRTSVIDSKANIVISLAGVFFVAITQIINLKKIFQIEIESFADALVPTLLLLTIIGSITTAFIAIIFFLKVVFTKKYKSLDAEYFYDINKLKQEVDLYSIAVSQFYIEVTKVNAFLNDVRVKWYKRGLILLIISIGAFALHTCLLSTI